MKEEDQFAIREAKTRRDLLVQICKSCSEYINWDLAIFRIYPLHSREIERARERERGSAATQRSVREPSGLRASGFLPSPDSAEYLVDAHEDEGE